MNTQSFKDSIKDLYTKKGELQAKYDRYVYCLDLLRKGEKIYGKRWVRNGRFSHLDTSKEDRVRRMLDCASVPYTIGNDGARGGQNSDYILLTAEGRQMLADVELNNIIKL